LIFIKFKKKKKKKKKDGLSYYCKNNTCVIIDSIYLNKFASIPDINGKIRYYISYSSWTYDEIKQNACDNVDCVSGD